MRKRTVILLMDSFGIGASEDAHLFGDQGADTLGHIVAYCKTKRTRELYLPNLAKLGLAKAAEASRKKPLASNLGFEGAPIAQYGYAVENSHGKDTPSGHWEIAGVPVLFDWHYFQNTVDSSSCFPEKFIETWLQKSDLKGALDAGHASGTEVLKELGEKHIKTGLPIIYTSADSVFQIAAHETHFGLERLYDICKIAREILDDMGLQIGRVIARPFVGESAQNFKRTGNRHDYSILPPAKTLLDDLKAEDKEVISIGKIADIYAHQGITQKIKATGIADLFQASLDAFNTAGEKDTLIFTNFVDFDSEYGHRRDTLGYAAALEQFDCLLPSLLSKMSENDLLVITADHGCDPTWVGTDHTREHIPAIFYSPSLPAKFIGERKSFADIGQSIACFMGLEKQLDYGVSWIG